MRLTSMIPNNWLVLIRMLLYIIALLPTKVYDTSDSDRTDDNILKRLFPRDPLESTEIRGVLLKIVRKK